MGVVMAFVGQLKLNGDPFARDGASPLGPVRAALEQLMRHVELGTAIILVVGPGGSGKSFLLGLAQESCRAGSERVQAAGEVPEVEQRGTSINFVASHALRAAARSGSR